MSDNLRAEADKVLDEILRVCKRCLEGPVPSFDRATALRIEALNILQRVGKRERLLGRIEALENARVQHASLVHSDHPEILQRTLQFMIDKERAELEALEQEEKKVRQPCTCGVCADCNWARSHGAP